MSFYYVISARKIKDNTFVSEPGPVRYLRVPWGQLPEPHHEIKSREWILEMRDLADGKKDDRIEDGGNVLIFVHGYNNGAQDIADRTRWLQEDLAEAGWNGVVAAFDWPCANSTLNYLEDRKDAAATALRLVDSALHLMAKGQAAGCKTNVHLLGHSTGAYVIIRAIELALQQDGELYKDGAWGFAQVGFIGADISAEGWTNSPVLERIDRMTNYQNGFDHVLAVSNAKRFGASPRMGRTGLIGPAHRSVVNVDCSKFFEKIDKRLQPRKTGTWAHSWHIGNPTWTLDFAMTLEGRIDRDYLPTREVESGRLQLKPGKRPEQENAWLD